MDTHKKITILLVEDQMILRTGVMLVLKRFKDLEVIGETDNGIDAVEKATALKPDVILMDISLRGISGIDATIRIKQTQPQVKILALTTHEEESSILSAFAAGIDGYCPKDILESELYQAIKTVWAGDLWLDGLLAKRMLRSRRPQLTRNTDSNESLTDVELNVFDLIVEGLDTQQTRTRLKIGQAEMRAAVHSILEKIRLTSH